MFLSDYQSEMCQNVAINISNLGISLQQNNYIRRTIIKSYSVFKKGGFTCHQGDHVSNQFMETQIFIQLFPH